MRSCLVQAKPPIVAQRRASASCSRLAARNTLDSPHRIDDIVERIVPENDGNRLRSDDVVGRQRPARRNRADVGQRCKSICFIRPIDDRNHRAAGGATHRSANATEGPKILRRRRFRLRRRPFRLQERLGLRHEVDHRLVAGASGVAPGEHTVVQENHPVVFRPVEISSELVHGTREREARHHVRHDDHAFTEDARTSSAPRGVFVIATTASACV